MEIFPLEYGFGDFSFEKWRFFLEDLFWRLNFWKKFNEDLFREIFPLEYGFGDFSFWRFFRGDFSLKIYSRDWTFEKNLMKICPWRFILRDFSIEVLEIFIEDLFIGDIWFGRFFLWKMENFPFENGDFFLWSQSEEDEDGDEDLFMRQEWWWFFFKYKKRRLWMRITLAGSWCEVLYKFLLSSCKKIISISNEFFHWNELEVLIQCP